VLLLLALRPAKRDGELRLLREERAQREGNLLLLDATPTVAEELQARHAPCATRHTPCAAAP